MLDKKIGQLLQDYAYLDEFFKNYQLDIDGHLDMTLDDFLQGLSLEHLEDFAIYKESLKKNLEEYINLMEDFLGKKDKIESITILPGQDKDGNKEGYEKIVLKTSDLVSIVGRTGAGKSRLLADIEWLASGDTPTKRRILINGQEPDLSQRFNPQNKIVAQLSQNMNFVMDLSVIDFLRLHADSRMVEDIDGLVNKILDCANDLAGEKFLPETNITALSGGQSRALMIADTAMLSRSPIVLIDEIENAGIDRHKALSLLVNEEKIVLIATHDPALALIAKRRLVLKNGGIDRIIDTSPKEREILRELEGYQDIISSYRISLREGKVLGD